MNENGRAAQVVGRGKRPMRTLHLAGILALTAMVSACETLGLSDETAADAGGTETADAVIEGAETDLARPGLPDAPDAIVRLQVEDYQQFLDQTIREYRFCVRSSALEIDDGTSSPEVIVERAQRRCEEEFRTAHRTANLLGDLNKVESLRAESRAAALESVIAGRSS
ncbi:MAG: hypothetical protein R3F55_20080 [Alphaproteobacteria bacterium]